MRCKRKKYTPKTNRQKPLNKWHTIHPVAQIMFHIIVLQVSCRSIWIAHQLRRCKQIFERWVFVCTPLSLSCLSSLFRSHDNQWQVWICINFDLFCVVVFVVFRIACISTARTKANYRWIFHKIHFQAACMQMRWRSICVQYKHTYRSRSIPDTRHKSSTNNIKKMVIYSCNSRGFIRRLYEKPLIFISITIGERTNSTHI